MPELPEVQTTTKGLQKTVVGQKILDVWTDLNSKDKRQLDTIKNPAFFKYFKKEVTNKKIVKVSRVGKNILLEISGENMILIHMKMTGHLLFGEYTKKQFPISNLKFSNKKQEEKRQARSDLFLPVWIPVERGPLQDPYNRFVHVVFTLSRGMHLAFCDSRKFGKITLIKKSELKTSKHLSHLGPDPTNKKFLLGDFQNRLNLKPKGKIKNVLMDQAIITGIGNIYSDETLWLAEVHPEKKVQDISQNKIKEIFLSMRLVLKKGINLGGDSMSDYRNILGKKGKFQMHHNVYLKKGEHCGKKGCSGVIIKTIIGGRSAHFCNKHQK